MEAVICLVVGRNVKKKKKKKKTWRARELRALQAHVRFALGAFFPPQPQWWERSDSKTDKGASRVEASSVTPWETAMKKKSGARIDWVQRGGAHADPRSARLLPHRSPTAGAQRSKSRHGGSKGGREGAGFCNAPIEGRRKKTGE